MGWTTPRDWTYELATSAKMDEVSDDLSWLGGNATTPSKSRPHCRVYDASKNHAAGSSGDWVAVEFDSSTTDVGPSAMYTASAAYITIPTTGFWLLSAYAQWTTVDATGVRGLALSDGAVSGAVPTGSIYTMATAPGSGNARSKVSVSCSTLVQLTASTRIYCAIFQSAGVALTVSPIVLSAIYMMV